MEYKDELYRIPFYMTYPMQNLYMMEMEYERDLERMKELYPKEVQRLREMIERRCDEMEYDGSRIYDENPDRFMLEEEVRRLLEKFLRENPQFGYMRPDMPPRPMPRAGEGLEAQQRWDGEQPWLRSLISILFHDEIYRRRCRHRRCRRWW